MTSNLGNAKCTKQTFPWELIGRDTVKNRDKKGKKVNPVMFSKHNRLSNRMCEATNRPKPPPQRKTAQLRVKIHLTTEGKVQNPYVFTAGERE